MLFLEFGHDVAVSVSIPDSGPQIYFVNITRPALDPLDYITRAKEFYLLAQRPKVIYNELYQQYVMWTYTDNYNLDLRMAGVMQSCWYNGPFTFTNVQEPDGNETTDLTVFVSTAGSGFLARTYYTNKTYYLPEPIMQPVCTHRRCFVLCVVMYEILFRFRGDACNWIDFYLLVQCWHQRGRMRFCNFCSVRIVLKLW